ncbi:MAG TPA: hypothetical protein VLA12_19745 [Planctomycetaceae bacterium]|nr:hypothetical protein [Planctomycetaceae bacterium]
MPQYLTEHVPILIAWLLAIIFCFKRRQENPRGAALLGIAVFIQLTSFGIQILTNYLLLSNYFADEIGNSMFWFGWGSHIFFGVLRLLTMVSWILIAYAVFPGRRDHRDIYLELSHDPTGDETASARIPR